MIYKGVLASWRRRTCGFNDDSKKISFVVNAPPNVRRSLIAVRVGSISWSALVTKVMRLFMWQQRRI